LQFSVPTQQLNSNGCRSSTKNMSSNSTNLSTFNNAWYQPGAGKIKQVLWYFINILFFINPLNPLSALKVMLLRWFGAKVGKGVVIKPAVNIKYPWRLHIGNHVWIGEHVWIDNLAEVNIQDHVCISQGAMLLTGSHNYKKTSFDLLTGTITLAQGSWVGAKAIVCPGITLHSHAVLAVNSVATHPLEAYFIYQGNPAQKKRKREL
jgi:putative colanic acid biosynthesis acetyltransferase WcaF